MSFQGGKLKLKGGGELSAKGGVKKKKKRRAETAERAELALAGGEQQHQHVDGQPELAPAADGLAPAPPAPAPDRRTEAEKRHEARLQRLEEDRAKKAALKSHRERIKEMNEKLASLTEHHDIPRISYSYM